MFSSKTTLASMSKKSRNEFDKYFSNKIAWLTRHHLKTRPQVVSSYLSISHLL